MLKIFTCKKLPYVFFPGKRTSNTLKQYVRIFLNFFSFLWVTFAYLDPDLHRIRIHNNGILNCVSVKVTYATRWARTRTKRMGNLEKNTRIKHPIGAVFAPVLGTKSYYLCCGSGSGSVRIHIILQDLNRHPGHADPDPGCPENLRIQSHNTVLQLQVHLYFRFGFIFKTVPVPIFYTIPYIFNF